ncbi:MAG: transposase, partial [Planctomycetota bacterium]
LMCAAAGDEGMRPGMVAVVQTAGDLANWHPHVHAIVSRGGWMQDGEWIPVAFVDEHSAELLYRHKVMRLLQDANECPLEPLSERRYRQKHWPFILTICFSS